MGEAFKLTIDRQPDCKIGEAKLWVKPVRAELRKAWRQQAGALTGFLAQLLFKAKLFKQQSKKIGKNQKNHFWKF